MFTHKSITTTVPSETELVTVLEAKQQLRLENTEDDRLVKHYIDTATAFCEHYTQRSFGKKQFTVYYADIRHCLILPFPPALPDPPPIVESYNSDTESWEVVDPSMYVYDWHNQPATICKATCGPIADNLWCVPKNPCIGSDPNSGEAKLRVTWWAGYGTESADVPLLVKQAIMLLTAHYYERRLASDNYSTEEIPFGVTVLLDSIRWRYYG